MYNLPPQTHRPSIVPSNISTAVGINIVVMLVLIALIAIPVTAGWVAALLAAVSGGGTLVLAATVMATIAIVFARRD